MTEQKVLVVEGTYHKAHPSSPIQLACNASEHGTPVSLDSAEDDYDRCDHGACFGND